MSSEVLKVFPPAAFADFRFIYPGPHLNEDGELDTRVRFSLPCGWDTSGQMNFFVFPFGSAEREFTPLVLDSTSWTG